MLAAYKKERYEAWKVTAHDKLNKFLQAHVLKKFHPQSSKFVNTTRFEEALLYKVSFPTHLEEVSVEAKLLEALGYEIPSFVKNIILQENSFYQQRNKIKLIIEELLDSLSDLKKEEISTLEIPIENLCSVLDLGVNQIQWESTDIPDFIKKSKQAVDIFRGFVHQIKNIVQEIDKKVKSLSTCDLFQFMKIGDSVPPCEAFFEDAKMHMEIKVQKMVSIYSSLEPLLKKLEMISCRTSTGRAPQMREYYYACEEKILKSIARMMLSNLEYFRDEVMEHFLFPYVEAAFQSKDELVTSSIIRIKLIFLNFMKTAIESTRKLIRWLDGTCIESKPFHFTEKKIRMEFSYYLDLSMHPQIKKLVLVILSNFFAYVDKQKSE
ncbi:Dynein heavy chain 10, axonemal [Araneus ventricosus]|uniref:Dynein heavy chain 10, axonemal n=1 Tax=Araneus ventricosus TaxID=182803 RepID=A0A4Y2QZS2_ARAVE|nr:Dynein heavy chain 10, axonemal [Araneus ventricosus]